MKRTLIGLALLAFFVMVLVSGCSHPAVTAAKIYLNQQTLDADKAIEQCKIAIQEIPNDPEPYYLMGKAYAIKKMYPEMNEAFDQSLQKGTTFASQINQERNVQWGTTLNAGVALYQADKPAEASEKFATCTVIMPEKAMAYKYLGSSLAQSGETEKAIEAFKKAVQLDSEDIESQYQLSNLYYNNKMYEEAIQGYEVVMQKADPSSKFHTDALSHIGLCYDILGQAEKAQEVYNTALAENPDNMDMRFNLARIFLKEENWDKALEMMQPVYEANPKDFGNCMNMGWALIGLNRPAEAVPCFKAATEVEPENHQAWFWLGTAYVRSGDSANGKIAFEKADQLKNK